MGLKFEFATATRIIFGAGAREQIAPTAAQMGSRVLVVSRRADEHVGALIDRLREHGVITQTLAVSGEPTVGAVTQGVAAAREFGAEVVIAMGGGSVLDTGKAIAALLTNGGEPLDYLEVIGAGRAITRPAAPLIAVPTTAGTGAEVTRNAVLGSPEHRVKASIRSPLMLPRLAVIDPELTYGLTPPVTAFTGMDALTQLIEPYTCNMPNPLVDALCADGIPRAARWLARAYHNGQDAEARANMSLVALLSGMALANARLGAVHGLAGVIGGLVSAPHGAICARLLAPTMEMNVRALQARAPASTAYARYTQVAQWLTGDTHAQPMDGVAWVRALSDELHIVPLAHFGLTASQFATIATQAQKASSMKGNALPLTDAELIWILEQAL